MTKLYENEEQIMPGVYFTPKSELSTLSNDQIQAMKDLPTENLLLELSILNNSLIQLHNSNDEMEKHVEKDAELAQYIVDNIQYMATIRSKISKMEEILQSRGVSFK